MKLRKKRTNKQTISIYFDKNYVYFRIYSCKNNNNIWFSFLERGNSIFNNAEVH